MCSRTGAGPGSPVGRATAARRVQSAFSILEILVALVIGVIVLLALTDIVTTSKVSYLREENVARMQESGRFATLMLAEDLRPTRSLDCHITGLAAQATTLSVKACSLLTKDTCTSADVELGNHVLTAEAPLGYDGADSGSSSLWLAKLPPAALKNVKDRYLRGDVLVTWGMTGASNPVTTQVAWPATANQATFTVAASSAARAGQVAVISDCAGTDVFTASAVGAGGRVSFAARMPGTGEVPGSQVNAMDTLSAAYNRPETAESGGRRYQAQLSGFRYSVYYVCCVDTAKGTLVDSNPRASCVNNSARYRPSLCAWDVNQRGTQSGISQVVVPDVADLRLTFGSAVDATTAFSTDDTTIIHTAKWVTSSGLWPDVASVNVELLVASPEEGRKALGAPRPPASLDWPPNQPNATTLDPDTLGASLGTDTRLYQRFVVNLAVRSRTPWYLGR